METVPATTAIAETDIINQDLCNRVLREFLDIYQKAANDVRTEHFDTILEIINKTGITFNIEETIDIFRNNFVDSLTEAFQKMWLTQKIPENLSLLEILKKRYKNQKTPQWRPYGKSVEEQTLPCRIRLLKIEKQFIMKQWEFQKNKLEKIVPEIERYKERIKNLIIKREVLSYRMKEQSDKFPAIKAELVKLQLEAINVCFPEIL